ncbi:MgtC/SapB family protein [Fusobacterium sp.]|uniref:MgtC/SapB family protein n=1 Tax=Fusobacterium sp. TaxID=68766 RepID=UPI0026096206|nr:MgtC/SapB family protein [Fusobacterium sp.]
MGNDVYIRIFLSVIFGGLIGLERELKGKPAGLITLTLVCLGATMIAILQENILKTSDITRLSAQVISGVGFIGGGAIIQTKEHVQGLTTAATLWISACLGLVIGYGLLKLAIFSFMMISIILILVKILEESYIYNQKRIKVLLTLKNSEDILKLKERFSKEINQIKIVKILWKDYNQNLVECTFSMNKTINLFYFEKELLKNNDILDYTLIS